MSSKRESGAGSRGGDSSGLDILVFSHFFYPEMGAPAARFADFGRLLVERGHRMTVVTGFPNFPTGRIHDGYRGRLWQREEVDGIEVLRGWLWASARRSAISKSLCFGTCAASASLWALFARLRADVVVATSPPPSVGLPGLLAARRHGAPLLLDLRDLWPEQLDAAGFIRSRMLVRILEGLERRLYSSADAITVVTAGKKTRLADKNVPQSKIEVVPNGVDLERFDSLERPVDELLASVADGADPFRVVYAGVFNPPQGLDVVVDAALWLRQETPAVAKSIQFLMVGDGSERRRIEERIRAKGLGRLVAFVGEQPRETIPSILRAADAVLVPLRPRRDTHTVPSKLYESLASGHPVLVSAAGEPADLVSDAGAGLVTPPGDGEALGRSVLQLVRDPAFAADCGRRGRAFVETYDRRRLVVRFEELLRRTAERGR